MNLKNGLGMVPDAVYGLEIAVTPLSTKVSLEYSIHATANSKMEMLKPVFAMFCTKRLR